MTENFVEKDLSTSDDVADFGPNGKKLWLFRVPKHLAHSLEGVKVRLPKRKYDQRAPKQEDTIVGRAGDVALRLWGGVDSSIFRALMSDDHAATLKLAPPFAGQINLSHSVAEDREGEGMHGERKRMGSHSEAVEVEPYQGREQLKGMRVRMRPAGAGTVYQRLRPWSSPASNMGGRDENKDGERREDSGDSSRQEEESRSGENANGITSVKTPKRRYSGGSMDGGHMAVAESEEKGTNVTSTLKTKKAKKKKTKS